MCGEGVWRLAFGGWRLAVGVIVLVRESRASLCKAGRPRRRRRAAIGGAPPSGFIDLQTGRAFSRTTTILTNPLPPRHRQAIAEAANGFDVPGTVAEFVSEPAHMRVDSPGIDYRVVTPDIAK
jgi:hypothetical protein